MKFFIPFRFVCITKFPAQFTVEIREHTPRNHGTILSRSCGLPQVLRFSDLCVAAFHIGVR